VLSVVVARYGPLAAFGSLPTLYLHLVPSFKMM